MKRGGIKKVHIILFAVLLSVILLGFLIAENSESSSLSEWRMFGRYLNHTAYDGTPFTVIPGLNYSILATSGLALGSYSPVVANGYVYIPSGATDNVLYQLNASNVSQRVGNFTTSPVSSSLAIANGYVYFVGNPGVFPTLYQLNATNISINYSSFQSSSFAYSSPIVANGYVYLAESDVLYQLNASNVSQQINNFTSGDTMTAYSTPAIANGYIYIGLDRRTFYQLNASNVSKYIANFSTIGPIEKSSPVVWNGYVYFGTNSNTSGNITGMFYQLNASNVSQQIANYTPYSFTSISSSPAIATIGGNTYVYFGDSAYDKTLYQLNASNISQKIANYTIDCTGVCGTIGTAPTVANGYVYFGSTDSYMYQVNASDVSNLVGKIYIGSSPGSAAYARGYLYFGGGSNVYQINASNLSSFAIIDIIPPVVSIGSPNSIWTYSGSVYMSITMNENGYCEYSLNGGTTNNTLDAYNGVPSWLFTVSKTLSDGAYTLNAYCNDTAGNRNDTTSVSFTMYTSSGSGGGSLPPTPPATTTETITSASPGQPAVIAVSNPKIDVTNITINVNQNVSNASLTITSLKNTTGADFRVSLRRGALYQAYEINVTGMNNSEITNVTIYFKVNMTWLANQNGTTNNIYLYRYYNSKWNRLPTTFLSQDSTYYYFKSVSPGFSTFVVFFGEYECELNTARCFNNDVQLCLGNSTWLVTEKCAYNCENGECVSIFNSNIFYVGIIIGVLTAIIMVLFFMFKRTRKRK